MIVHKRGIYYFGGGYQAAINDVHVPAAAADAEDGGADPVIFEQPGTLGDLFRDAEREAANDHTLI
jgi:hypothetical protein